MKDAIILSGTSNPHLARAISEALHKPLGNVEITRFIDNECRVYVKEDVKGKHVFVIQSLSQIADQHLVELCLLGAAIKDLEASQITAVIPWMGYSKQDRAFRKGEAVSASLVAKFIQTAGFDSVVTSELHSENVLPYFSIPVTELSTHELLASAIKREKIGAFVVVSPDKGGKSRSERFAAFVGAPVIYIDKARDGKTGSVTIQGMSAQIENKNAVIFDDIINTGETAVKTSAYLKAHGATHVYFLSTHGVFAGDGAAQLSTSSIDSIIVTDTIDIPKSKQFSKLHIESVAPLFANALSGSIA